jgi:hypothetical protein
MDSGTFMCKEEVTDIVDSRKLHTQPLRVGLEPCLLNAALLSSANCWICKMDPVALMKAVVE